MDKRIFILTLMLSTILAACWDIIEIEKRSFIYGMAIDTADSSSEGEIKLTEQLIVPENVSASTSDGGNGKAYYNISDNGDTIFDIDRKISEKTSHFTDASHLNVVLFSEEVAKKPKIFEEYMDEFFRGKRMRRGIKVAIASGEAKELLEIDIEHEKLPTEFMNNLLENKQKLDVVDLIRIGDIQERILEKTSFPLAQLKRNDENNTIEFDGMAIYHGHKHQIVGSLKGNKAKGLSFVRGLKNNGTINMLVDGEETTIEILKIKRKFSLKNKDKENLKILVELNIIGMIGEQVGYENIERFEVLKKFEDETTKKVEEIVKETIDTLQHDVQADAIGLSIYLSRFHPKVWDEVKDNWDFGENYFEKTDIEVKARVKIEEPGNINRTTIK